MTVADTNIIRRLRRERGLTMQQLADALDVHFTTVAKWERSERRPTVEVMKKLAETLQVSLTELIENKPAAAGVRMVPMVGKISAGNWQEAVEVADGHAMSLVGGPRAFALRPEGTSMNRIVREGGYVVVDPDDFELRDGKAYAVMNAEGATTFKQFRADPPRLEPCSNDPTHKPIALGREPFTVIGRVVWQGSEV